MKIKKLSQTKGFTLVELLVVISIIALLAGLAVPQVMKAMGRAELVKGVSNARGIKTSMDNFALDFDGEYPSDSTAEELADLLDENVGGRSSRGVQSSRLGSSRGLDGGSRLDRRGRGDDSRRTVDNSTANQYFQQLITRKTLDNEELFFLKAYRKAFRIKKPDMNGELETGENVFGYTKGLIQTSTGRIPVVFDSPISTGENPKFSKKVWDGNMVMVTMDNSARSELIGGAKEAKTGIVKGKVDGETLNLFAEEALEEGFLVPADLKAIGSSN